MKLVFPTFFARNFAEILFVLWSFFRVSGILYCIQKCIYFLGNKVRASHRRRIKTEDKAKDVAAVGGTELL